MATRTYYHVTQANYQKWEPIYCRNSLENLGINFEEKWENGLPLEDYEFVCFSDTLDEAREFLRELVPDGKILAVEIPEEYIWTNKEGYHCVKGDVPSEWVTVVS